MTFLLMTSIAFTQDFGVSKSFEGTMQVKFQTVDAVRLLVFSVKRKRIRVDAAVKESGGAFVLVDHPAKKKFLVFPSREQYVEMTLPDQREGSRQTGIAASYEKTAETDEIAGLTCDKLLVKLAEVEIEIWATKALGTPGTFCTDLASTLVDQAPWETDLFRSGYFPLKVSMRDTSGNEQALFEVSAPVKKAVKESLFHIPADYEKTSAEALMPKQPTQKKKTR